MKKTLLAAACLLLLVAGFEAAAQRKKVLKEENAALKRENGQLRSSVTNLQSQNRSLEDANGALRRENGALKETVERLREDSASLAVDYQLARKDLEALQSEEEEGEGGGEFGGAAIDPNDTRQCARLNGTLQAGRTYTENFNVLKSEGWGVQIYSFSDLCSAVEKAEEFRSYYHLFKTYIRVKEVNGRTIYSVVYGSLKDEQQARVYCENFRGIAKDEEGRNAFIVQHAY